MKILYLVRHAKSSWKDLSLDDIDRPLNKRGKRDAAFMASLIHQQGIRPDVLISSPANRALTTARFFATALEYSEERILINKNIYEASVSELLQIVQKLNNNWDSAMLFGHNMTYTLFANLYAHPILENVPTCGIVALRFNISDWAQISRSNGSLLFFEYPRRYFPKK